MEKFIPEIMEFTVDSKTHVVEFCRESMKEADSMGVTSNDSMGIYDRTALILYAGLKKNEPFISMRRAKEILDSAFEEGYSLDDFAEIVDEFTRCYKALFTGEGKKKGLVTRRNAAAKVQK